MPQQRRTHQPSPSRTRQGRWKAQALSGVHAVAAGWGLCLAGLET